MAQPFADQARMMHRSQDHREVELKFELDGRAAMEVRRHAVLRNADHFTTSQKSIYFDTDDGDVHRAGYSLRVRKVGKCFTQTVKTNPVSTGLFNRGEWETQVEQMALDPKALGQTPLGNLRDLGRKAKPVSCLDVERTTWLIDRDGSMVEVALDSATVSSASQKASLHELELELKGGKQAALFDFAHELSHAVPLKVSVLSKEERGRMLAEGACRHEYKASVVDIRKEMDIGQVFALLVQECVRHFRLNEALIIAERDPDALHQARVAMRRLRTAFSLFHPAIRQSSLKPLRKELRRFASPFGEARNLDMFLNNHGDELGDSDRRKLTSARAKAYKQVIETLKSQPSRDMFLDLVVWTASEDWRKDAASAAIRKFATAQLDAAWRKVRRQGKGLNGFNEKQLHKLRISIKKLRYAVDFLAPLYAKKRARKFALSLEKIQNCLGLLHDDVISRQIVS